jgi:hypothetical protein
MKFTIDDGILKAYASLPEVFRLSDIFDKASINEEKEYVLVSPQVHRMA